MDDVSTIRNITTMDALKKFISKHQYRIIYKPSSEMKGFLGLHYEIGDDFGFRIGKNTIWIDQNIRGRELYRTLKHEVEELILMRQRGMKYFPAHKQALKDETR